MNNRIAAYLLSLIPLTYLKADRSKLTAMCTHKINSKHGLIADSLRTHHGLIPNKSFQYFNKDRIFLGEIDLGHGITWYGCEEDHKLNIIFKIAILPRRWY